MPIEPAQCGARGEGARAQPVAADAATREQREEGERAAHGQVLPENARRQKCVAREAPRRIQVPLGAYETRKKRAREIRTDGALRHANSALRLVRLGLENGPLGSHGEPPLP